MDKRLKTVGRYMSKILRHDPSKEGITLDSNGYCEVVILCEKLKITEEELEMIVTENDKQRFAYNYDKSLIRASQGHSVDVNIDYKKCTDVPQFIYHGTDSNLKSVILTDGIKKMSRTHVHLSKDIVTATKVGLRKSKDVVILQINAKQMVADGVDLYISDNGVYLTDFVDSKYIKAN